MLRLLLRLVPCAVALAVAPVACAQETPGGVLRAAREALGTGHYADAVTAARRAMAADSADSAPVRTLAAALAATGKYSEAEDALLAFTTTHPRNPDAWNDLGELQRTRGRLAQAEASFRRAITGSARDSLTAVLNLARLRFDRGEVDEAMREFDRFIDIYNNRRAHLTASELAAVAEACRYLGRNNPELFKDALRAYDDAIAADSAALEPRVRLAELFLEKYQPGDAEATLAAVLKANPNHAGALLVMARTRYFNDGSDATRYLQRSLEVNPVSADARAFSALLLIDLERYDEAAEEARRGLAVDSTAPGPSIALAAALYLKGDTAAFQTVMAEVHAREPRSAEAEATLAEVAARNRLYAEAVDFARAAVARDGKAAGALATLGINALRLGDIQQARDDLERAFALDPYNVWAKNTLDMLDTFKDYADVHTPRFELVIENKDAPVISLYAEALAEQAYDSLAARYQFRPATPVRVEFYRSHDDFSVRTVGLGGLGALGVTFGRVVAMDSPAARKVGEFNWGSTLWHELAHVFTLGRSANRVPRWFAEGLSVYEERRARPAWGEDASPLFFAAYKGGQLPRVSRMNDGFMRPAFPAQVVLSYYQASLVCQMIEEEHGIGAIRAMLDGYRNGRTTEQLFHDVLRTDPAAFDDHFDNWVGQHFGRELASVKPMGPPARGEAAAPFTVSGDFTDAFREGNDQLKGGRVDEAIASLRRAKQMIPEYADENGPYGLLARAFLGRGDEKSAARELTELTAINEEAYQSNVKLADLLEGQGDLRGAAAALDRTVWINPFDPAIHQRLATLAERIPDRTLVVRERRAILALDPVDRVDALYQLALAYSEAGDTASARREVLRALELAPNFEKAQQLLLKLQGTGGNGGTR